MATINVLILEDDRDLADTYRLMFSLLIDCKPHIAHSVSELLGASGEALSCSVALLDINLGDGAPSGLDAYRWLREQGFAGRIYFVTGHARTHPLVAQACSLEGAAVLKKPVEIDRLIEAVTGAAA